LGGRGGGDWRADPTLSDAHQRAYEHIVGRWAADSVAIIGDYYEDGDVSTYEGNLYERIFGDGAFQRRDDGAYEQGDWVDISEQVLLAMEHDGYIREQMAKRNVLNVRAAPSKMGPNGIIRNRPRTKNANEV
jgi:hypothetical protein